MRINTKILLGSTVFITIVTLLSRVFGFFREIILAYKLGVSELSDAFVLATTLPQIIFTSFTLAIGINFIPIYLRVKSESAEDFYKIVQTSLAIISFIILLIFLGFADEIIRIISPGSSKEFLDITVEYAKISIVSIVFIGYLNLSVSKFNVNRKQLIGVTLPIVTSLFTILGLVLYGYFSIELTFYLILVSYIFQFIIIFFYLENYKIRKENILTVLKKKKNQFFEHKNNLILLYKRAIPTMMSTYIDQFIPLFERFIASYLMIGALTYLNYSHRLNGLLVGVIGSLITTLFYPVISKYIKEKSTKKNVKINYAFNNILIVCIPITYFMAINSQQIVSLVYQNGRFNETDVTITATIFSIFVIGGLFNILRSFLNTIFFSSMNTKDPFLASLIVIVCFSVGAFINRILFTINIFTVAWIEVFSFLIGFLYLVWKSSSKKLFKIRYIKLFPLIIIINLLSILTMFILSEILYVDNLIVFPNEKLSKLVYLSISFIPYGLIGGLGLFYNKKNQS